LKKKIPKAQATEAKIDKWNYIKQKSKGKQPIE
jgi:hypothetical protein